MFIFRYLTALLSVLVLAAAAYLLWSWYQGDWIRELNGVLVREREPWRLWTGGALMAWSFLGRPLVLLLLARPDKEPVSSERGEVRVVRSPTGALLHLELHGRAGAPPIIFTHGWGMDLTAWRYARRDLADRFRLVMWDLPGLGRSTVAGRKGIALEAFATDLAAVIAATGAARPVLVGHSIGGMTIQTLIRDHPQVQERLAGLVLLNTTYTNPLKTMVLSGVARALQAPLLEPLLTLAAWLQPLTWLMMWQSYLSGSSHLQLRLGFGKFVTRGQLDHCALLSARNSPAVQARGDIAMFHWDATDALQGLALPMLVVGGDLDIVTKLEANRTVARESPTSRLEVVNGVNHLGPIERADIYDRLIADFALSVQTSATYDLKAAAAADPQRPGEPPSFAPSPDEPRARP